MANEILTAVQRAINEYGKDNISMVGYSYHGRYEDDDCSFTYYNNVTGEFFHDAWTTRCACPPYSDFECQTLDKADELGLVDHEKLYNMRKNGLIKTFEDFKVTNWMIGDSYDQIAKMGLRVEVKGGRKWKGIGFLVGTFKTSYQWAAKRWHSNNDYGVTTTRHAKIYDPLTNRVEVVTANQVKLLDFDKIVEQYKADMIALVEAATVENLKIGKNSTSYSPYSGDSNRTSIELECGIISFMQYLESKANKINLENAYDVIEEEKKAKEAKEAERFAAFKEKKMAQLIEWVKTNTDKEGEEIQKLAEKIFHKKYE